MMDRLLERRIKELKVYCSNKDGGCDWVGEVLYLQDHLQKHCAINRVSCPFESFGCKERLLEKDMDAHVADMLSHMLLLLEQFDAQQERFDRLIQAKVTKIRQLEQSIDEFEANMDRELKNKSDSTWHLVDPGHSILLANSSTPPGIKQCRIPEHVAPNGTKEILIALVVHSCTVTPQDTNQCITVFVEEGGVHMSKYIKLSPWKQNNWNDNTENVWLPMPTNRLVHVHVPTQFRGGFWLDIILIGRR